MKFARTLWLIVLLHLTTAVWAQRTKLTEEQTILLGREFIDGTKEKILGNKDKALAHFNRCLEVDPQHAPAHYQVADLLFLKNELEGAAKSILLAITYDPDNLWYRKLQLEILDAKRDYREAAKTSIRLAEKGNDYTYYINAAYYYQKIKAYKDAIQVLNKAEVITGVNEDISYTKEQLYLTMGKPKLAIAELQKLIAAYPKESRYQGMLADLYMNTNQVQKGVTLYHQILRNEPQNGYAGFALADYYYSIGKPDTSITYLLIGVRATDIGVKQIVDVLVPFSSNSYLPKLSNRKEEVLKAFTESHPQELAGYLILGDYYFQQQQFDTARVYYQKGIQVDQSNSAVWFQLITCDDKLNDYTSMLSHAKQGVELFPFEITFCYYAAFAAYRVSEYEQAITLAKLGLELSITGDELREALLSISGDAAHYAGKFALCDSIYTLTINEYPESALALNNYAYFLSLRKTKLAEAESFSKKSLELQPGNPSYLDTYAWIKFQQGDYETAWSYIKQVIESGNTSAEVWEHAGDIAYKLGKKTEALTYWKRAQENGANSPTLTKKIAAQTWYE